MLGKLKSLFLPDRVCAIRVLWGPFRGATIYAKPRDSLRKMVGLYERELNPWISAILPRVNTVIDVGANDGYFTFGCAAALNRLGKKARVIAFEPDLESCLKLAECLEKRPGDNVSIVVEQKYVGDVNNNVAITLDSYARQSFDLVREGSHSLIKIDVEGAEVQVVEGALEWLKPQNYFLIEIHNKAFIDILQRRFADFGIALREIEQQTLPILGPESRTSDNSWLVTDLIGQ
jgi:hypothetical protein